MLDRRVARQAAQVALETELKSTRPLTLALGWAGNRFAEAAPHHQRSGE